MRTIVTLNLRQGGSSRIDALHDYLSATAADFIVCTEFRNNKAGEKLCGWMTETGRQTFLAPAEHATQNGVAIFAPTSASRIELDPPLVDRHRIVGCQDGDFVILGVYFAQLKAKASLFGHILSMPYGDAQRTLIIGDFNTGQHYLDEAGATFNCAKEFAGLAGVGLVDLWRQHNGEDLREYSWHSNRGGGFRIDHAFATRGLAEQLLECRYDHTTRGKISDHSAMMVRFDV